MTTKAVNPWLPATDINALDAAFGISDRDIKRRMPAMSDIPEEFKSRRDNKWLKFQGDWFFHGLVKLSVTPKPGIDRILAMRHLAAIQTSFAPKHEHKMAAVAYLASLWFEDVKYTIPKAGGT